MFVEVSTYQVDSHAPPQKFAKFRLWHEISIVIRVSSMFTAARVVPSLNCHPKYLLRLSWISYLI